MRARYVAQPWGDESWVIRDRNLGVDLAGYTGPEAARQANSDAVTWSLDHDRELQRAHEEALAYHRRLYPPPSTRYRIVADWHGRMIVDDVGQVVIASGFRNDPGSRERLEEMCERLNLGDARRNDHARRTARYGTCRSWRVYWERWRPMVSRCAWPADHVEFTKWHCAEGTTDRIWLVGDRERKEF